jgi:hypothetical protein
MDTAPATCNDRYSPGRNPVRRREVSMRLRALGQVRTLVLGGILGALVVPLTGYGANAIVSSGPDATVQRQAELYQIDQVERTFHRAGSTHDVNLMMSLWAPGATFNIGANTYIGKEQIRRFFATQNPVFQPKNHWVSDTPSYKIRITVDGDKATLYFQCHYVDVRSRKVVVVVGVDHNLQKINGKWLIVSGSGSPAVLSQ